MGFEPQIPTGFAQDWRSIRDPGPTYEPLHYIGERPLSVGKGQGSPVFNSPPLHRRRHPCRERARLLVGLS
jgi:hypothetical protein